MGSDSSFAFQSDLIRLPFTSDDSPGFSQQPDSTDLSALRDQDLLVDRLGEYPVGCGGHSDVWKANMTRNGVMKLVALKVLRCSGSDQARLHKRLEREVKCWEPLSHKNIAPFYGVHYQSNGAPALMLPWYRNGSANVYLRDHPSKDPIQIIKGIADGVQHLHDKGIAHGDLKGANVMIDDVGHAILIDFGLARLIDEAGITTSMSSSVRWCAPELLSPNYTPTTKASDVYAFASTALELLSGDVPYNMILEAWVPLEIMKGTTPPSLSSGFRYDIACAAELWRLLDSCWAKPSLRPSIQIVRQRLQDMYLS